MYKDRPLVSLISVNFNQPAVTFALLDSIRRQRYSNLEIWVVDNGSADDPGPHLALHYPEVTYIRSEKNLGFAGGNNLAARKAQGDFLFFVNNDAELTDNCLDVLVDLFRQTPGLGIASPLLCYHPETTRIQYAGMTPIHPLTGRNRTLGAHEINTGQFNEPLPTAYAHGAAMMVSRAALEKAGMMAEDFFLYYEELDWCERIRNAGFSIYVEPRACVFHKESVSVRPLGALKTYFLNRNRIYFMRRHVKGIKKLLFYAFLIGVTTPKQLIQFTLRGQADLRLAFLQALSWNFFGKMNEFEHIRPKVTGSV